MEERETIGARIVRTPEGETVGTRIARLRKFLGLSQAKLARACGVHALTVSKWERGVSKPDRHFMRLAPALHVSAFFLFHGVEETGEFMPTPDKKPEEMIPNLRHAFFVEGTMLSNDARHFADLCKPESDSAALFATAEKLDMCFALLFRCFVQYVSLGQDCIVDPDWQTRVIMAGIELREIQQLRILRQAIRK